MRTEARSTPSPAGGRRGFLSVTAITREAREIAETEGLEQVSMRAVSVRLGCTPRALYRHVADKEALLELVADSAFADLAEPRADVPWEEAFLEYFTAMRGLLVEAPAVALIIAQLPVAGTNFRRHADSLVALMTDAGFPGPVAVEAVMALAFYTLGASLPGTGDTLLDAHRRLRESLPADELASFQRVAPDFADHAAAEHFRSALRHLIRGYAVDG